MGVTSLGTSFKKQTARIAIFVLMTQKLMGCLIYGCHVVSFVFFFPAELLCMHAHWFYCLTHKYLPLVSKCVVVLTICNFLHFSIKKWHWTVNN